jgi:hypothetical protein
MTNTTITRRLSVPVAVGALLLIIVVPSYGKATVGNFSFQDPISGTETGIVGCFPDLTGTITGTETVTGHFVDTGQGFHFSGTATQDYRIDFVDGRYLITSSPSHFEGDTNRNGGNIYTEAQQDFRTTLYNADGTSIGRLTTFTLTHVTWIDTNGNGNPDPGEITANVSNFRQTCP